MITSQAPSRTGWLTRISRVPKSGSLFLACLGTALIISCGAPDAVSPSSAEVQALSDTTTTAAVNYSAVVLGAEAGRSPRVSPASVPAEGSASGTITLSYYVNLDSSKATGFAYDKSKWAVWVGSTTASQTRLLVAKDFTLSDGTESTSGGRVGLVQISVDLGNPLPESIVDKTGGRRQLWFELFYSPEGKAPTESPSVRANPTLAIKMKDDVGALTSAPSLDTLDSGDGALRFTVTPPGSLESETVTNNQIVAVSGETSTVAAYALVIWDIESCRAAIAGGDNSAWSFAPHPVYAGSADPNPTPCTFNDAPGVTSNGCALGCSQAAAFSGLSQEEVAIPPQVPSSDGWKNATQTGCTRVVRVPASQSTVAVSGLTNGRTYEAFVYAIDGSGKLSRRRSACVKGTPLAVPLGSTAKTPELNSQKTRSDCFVVSATRGTNSAATFAWQIIRDKYLQGTWFHQVYLFHGPAWAQWIKGHPLLRNIAGSVLETTGKWAIWLDKIFYNLNNQLKSLGHGWNRFFSSTAWAGPVADTNQTSENTTKAEANSSSDTPTVWPRSHFQAGAFYLQFLEDSAIYQDYYPKKVPLRFFAHQTLSLFDAVPALGLGLGVSYTTLKGHSPATSLGESAVPGKPLQIYSFGIFALADWTFLHLAGLPWLSPQVTLRGGIERFREEASSAALSTSETLSPLGITKIKPHIGIQVSLGISLLSLSQSARQARFGYGLTDMLLVPRVGYARDLDSKALSMSALEYGLGVDFLFL